MQENNIITLANGGRYLLLHDLEDVEGQRYFYAVGVTPNYEIDAEDNLFFLVTEENGKTLIEKVDPQSELYQKLLTIELVDSSVENVPGFKERFDEFMQVMEARESSE